MADPKDILDALALAERLAGKSISISPRHGRTMLRKTMAEHAHSTGVRVTDSSSAPAAAGPTAIERHSDRPLGPSVACASDLPPTPLHTPPEQQHLCTMVVGEPRSPVPAPLRLRWDGRRRGRRCGVTHTDRAPFPIWSPRGTDTVLFPLRPDFIDYQRCLVAVVRDVYEDVREARRAR